MHQLKWIFFMFLLKENDRLLTNHFNKSQGKPSPPFWTILFYPNWKLASLECSFNMEALLIRDEAIPRLWLIKVWMKGLTEGLSPDYWMMPVVTMWRRGSCSRLWTWPGDDPTEITTQTEPTRLVIRPPTPHTHPFTHTYARTSICTNSCIHKITLKYNLWPVTSSWSNLTTESKLGPDVVRLVLI